MTLSFEEIAPALAHLALVARRDGVALHALQITSAEHVVERRFAEIDPGQPALLLGLRDSSAEALAEALSPHYPPTHEGLLLAGDGERSVLLIELDRLPGGEIAGGEALFVPPLSRPGSFAALQQIVVRLRAPDGCPWDRELTWDKVRPFLLEETHELLEAMDSGQPARVAEEIGDMLLQLAMQMQMASEEGLFRAPDVIAGIVAKLVRRHPHVFGDVAVSGTDEVLANWEAIKRDERKAKGDRPSPLSGVPAGLPALAQADAYQERIARIEPLQAADNPWEPLAQVDGSGELDELLLGDALFGIVNWARQRGLDAESALRAANARFAQRYE